MLPELVTSCAGTSLLNASFEGKIEGRMEVTGIRVGKRKRLLDDLMEKRGY